VACAETGVDSALIYPPIAPRPLEDSSVPRLALRAASPMIAPMDGNRPALIVLLTTLVAWAVAALTLPPEPRAYVTTTLLALGGTLFVVFAWMLVPGRRVGLIISVVAIALAMSWAVNADLIGGVLAGYMP
jgi:hypothetical protein